MDWNQPFRSSGFHSEFISIHISILKHRSSLLCTSGLDVTSTWTEDELRLGPPLVTDLQFNHFLKTAPVHVLTITFLGSKLSHATRSFIPLLVLTVHFSLSFVWPCFDLHLFHCMHFLSSIFLFPLPSMLLRRRSCQMEHRLGGDTPRVN